MHDPGPTPKNVRARPILARWKTNLQHLEKQRTGRLGLTRRAQMSRICPKHRGLPVPSPPHLSSFSIRLFAFRHWAILGAIFLLLCLSVAAICQFSSSRPDSLEEPCSCPRFSVLEPKPDTKSKKSQSFAITSKPSMQHRTSSLRNWF